MKYKIALLWLFLAIGFMLHHIYGLSGVYFGKQLTLENATGKTPNWAHYYRLLFEIIILIMALTTLEVTKKWFKITAFIWSVLLGIFNIYHVIEAVINEPENLSELILLVWMVAVSVIIIKSLNNYRKQTV